MIWLVRLILRFSLIAATGLTAARIHAGTTLADAHHDLEALDGLHRSRTHADVGRPVNQTI